jgi:protein-disulfide isomerase
MAAESTSRWRAMLDTVASVAVIALCGTLVYSIIQKPVRTAPAPTPTRNGPRTEPPLPPDPIGMAGSVRRGAPQARVVMLEFSDFECPFCGKFARETMPSIVANYVDKGLVELAFRQLPLDIHKSAKLAAVATNCAIDSGKFWQLHDFAFTRQKELSADLFLKEASALGIPKQQYEKCLKDTNEKSIDIDAQQAKSLNINGTPTFFVGVRKSVDTFQALQRLTGAQAADRFDVAIASALKAAAAANPNSKN